MWLPLSLLLSLFPYRCPAPSPRRLSISTPHEQSLAGGCGGAVRSDCPAVVALVPSPQCPYPRARSGGWGCCGDGGGGGGHHRPHRDLAVMVVVQWGVLGRPCLRWCPRPHPLSLSLSPPCPAPLSSPPPHHHRHHSARSLSSLSLLLPVSTPQADARGGGPG